MGMWETLRVSHIPTPSAATTDKLQTRRYTNNLLGTKDRSGQATPSSHTISSALRVGIESFGIPQILYVDNGKDYEKVGRIDFSPECSGVLVRLGIEGQYCLPRHPQSKLIESWFGTVRKRFDCLWPSYCGPGPKDRPEQCMAALKEHQDFLKG